jgi:hypothetical protein
MQADRWKKVEGLFEAAMGQPPETRQFVEQASDDPLLRSEVSRGQGSGRGLLPPDRRCLPW